MILYGQHAASSYLDSATQFNEVGFDKMMTGLSTGQAGMIYAGGIVLNDPSSEIIDNNLIAPFYANYAKKNRRPRNISNRFYRQGPDNGYPLFRLDLLKKSVILASAIESIGQSARGEGARVEGGSEEENQKVTDWLERVKANYWFEKELFEQLAYFRGSYVEIVVGNELIEQAELPGVKAPVKALRKVKLGNYIKWRVGVKNEDDETEFFYFHPNFYGRRMYTNQLRAFLAWPGAKEALSNVRKITVFKSDEKTKFFEKTSKSVGRYVYFLRHTGMTSEVYPTSALETEAAINASVLDAIISQFDLAGMQNGLTLRHIVTIPLAKPRSNKEEDIEAYKKRKAEIRGMVQNKFQGPENNEGVLVLYTDPRTENTPVEISEVPNSNNEATIDGKAVRKDAVLMNAFRVTHPALIGIQPTAGRGLNHQNGVLKSADDIWYVEYVLPLVQMAEQFYKEVLLPLYREETGADISKIKITFPRKERFKNVPDTKIMLKTFTTQQIWDRFGNGPYTDEKREILKRDLADRGEVSPTNTDEPLEEDNEPQNEDQNLNGQETLEKEETNSVIV